MRTIMLVSLTFFAAGAVGSAHCDSVDGPVVQAARRALASGNVNLVLPWVQPNSETAIREAFSRTIAVRKLNPDAAKLADTWFFETLVRVHRAGEGASYDGLKPTGSDVPEGIAAADHAVATGSIDKLDEMLSTSIRKKLRDSFQRVVKAKDYESSDVAAGREYVAAYVEFIHIAERLENAVHGEEHGH
jgi:hypothetical protein